MLKRAISFLREAFKPEVKDLSPSDKEIIFLFAAGDTSFRVTAINIYREHLPKLGARANIHMCFMSEIDNPSPDAELRAFYRRRILKTDIRV